MLREVVFIVILEFVIIYNHETNRITCGLSV